MLKLENLLIAFYGLSTVVVFTIMVIAGGLFDSLHTLLFREVSFFISPYAHNHTITIPLYRIYNFDLLMFALLLFVRLRNVFAKIGALYLSLSSVMSLLLVNFPLDPAGISYSFAGASHVAIASLTAGYVILSLVLLWQGLKRNKSLALFAKYSLELSVIIIIAGFLTGLFALLSMPIYVGFVQKLPILAFLAWIVLTTIIILKSDKRVKYTTHRK